MQHSQAQQVYPEKYFSSPFDFSLKLSGSFAELRSNHFHSGIDILTKGVENQPIKAVAEGYISRINVSSRGYGKALYITHPNGYVSVYGHMNAFNDTITKVIRKEQYTKQEFAMNFYPKKGQISIKKGEIIGLSGNTGSSFGAHLHFEIRDEKTEHPINPLLFGFSVKDTQQPVIYNLAVFPLSKNTSINNQNKKKLFPTKGWNGYYKIIPNYPIKIHGKVAFGFRANDFMNGSYSRCGVVSAEVWVDSTKIYHHKLKEFSFDNTRYLNSLVDFKERKKSKLWVQKCFVEPNNYLNIYKDTLNRGIFNFDKDSTYTVTIILRDTYKNTSKLKFKVKSSSKPILIKQKEKKFTQKMVCGVENSFEKEDVKFTLPKTALYDTLYFNYKKSNKKNRGVYSKIHNIHDSYTPVHNYYQLWIKSDAIPEHLQSKLLIVKLNNFGKMSSRSGEFENNGIKTKVREFGKYAVSIDTIPPRIRAINIYERANLRNSKSIDFYITDNLSGIKTYNGYINDQWVLFDYDAKSNRITYRFDKYCPKNGKKHQFLLKIKDDRNNEKIFKCNFYR